MNLLNHKDQIRGTKYDAIIVGAGLAGAVHAQQLAEKTNMRILVVEKRQHIAGNIFTEKKEGIDIHKYGSHIFHTNNDEVWEYLNRFTEFNDYKHRVVAATGKETVMLPFTMVTFMQLFNVQTEAEVKARIDSEVADFKLGLWLKNPSGTHKDFENNTWEPKNFEEQAIVLVGRTIYEKLIKHYTEKQWGRKATELPAAIIKRLPLRWNTDTTYFNNAKYQGIPVDGYTMMVYNMLDHPQIDVLLNTDFLQYQDEITLYMIPHGLFVYTGAIDELMNYKFGALEYRSLEFDELIIDRKSYQGTAVVNFTDDRELTRITEHKFYSTDKEILDKDVTVISLENSTEHIPGKTIPYYPIGDEKNKAIHAKYVEAFRKEYSMGVLAGRLAQYQYYDMDKVTESALLSMQELLVGMPKKS